MSTPKERRKIDKYLDIRDKVAGVNYYTDTMLNKTITMFKYKKYPQSLPERDYELMKQTDGKAIVTVWDDKLIALDGQYAPPLDGYYRSGYFIVNNPWAGINHTFELVNHQELIRNKLPGEHKPAILVRNDPLERGLLPIIHRFAALLTETDLTMYLADVNFRSIYNIVANTDQEFESAKLYLQQIEAGKQGVMLEEDLSNGIKTNPYSNSSQGYITQIIELEQYLRGTFHNEIGLNANYNMKRERLSANETELNEDSLRPLIDVMLEERKKENELIKEYFPDYIDPDADVEFGSAWAKYNENPVEEDEEPIELTSEEEIEDEGQGDADTNGDAAGEIDTVASGDVDEVSDTNEGASVEDDVADDDENDVADDESESEGDGDSGDDTVNVTVEVKGDDNNVEITLDDEITDDIIKEEEDNEDEN